jgi:hypothetical protein
MRQVFSILLNMLIFFFLVGIFGSAISVIGGSSVINKVIVGLIFGIFMMLIPNVLKFFKLPVNGASLLLMGVIVSFVFYFVSIYILSIISVTGSSIDLGIAFFEPILLQDRTVALVFLSLVSAGFSVGMDILSKRK